MKNIKVNLINETGKRSSTTINFSICQSYYTVVAAPVSNDDDVDCHVRVDNYLRSIAIYAQSYVNKLCAEAIDDGSMGVSKSFIERCMLDEVINSYRFPF